MSQLFTKVAARPTTFQFAAAGSTAPGRIQRARVLRTRPTGRVNAAIVRDLGVHLSTVRRRRKRVDAEEPATLQDHKETVYWGAGTARLLPRLLKGRTRGPVFVTHRKPGPGKVVTSVGDRLRGRVEILPYVLRLLVPGLRHQQ